VGSLQLRHEKISESFCQFCINNEVNDIRRKVAACVKFTRQEMFCVPPFLWFEMYRGAGDNIDHRHNSERVWMDWAEVDAQPFMLYMQYLTFRSLGKRHRQLQVLGDLEDLLLSPDHLNQSYHPESVENMVGHCYELEGDLQSALRAYRHSIENVPRNNAANWHIQRLARYIDN